MVSKKRGPSAPMSLGEAQLHLEAVRQRQEKQAQEALRSIDRGFSELRAYRRWVSRWGPWAARLALVPLAALFAAGCHVIALALVEGRTKSFIRYSNSIHVQSEQPVEYWFSVGGYVAFTIFFAWLVVVALRAAKLRE